MNPRTSSPDLERRIEASLDGIRPYLLADGGDIRLIQVSSDMTVQLEFLGACGKCPISPMTFKAGVEEAIRRSVPEVRSIEIINLTAA